MRCGRWRTWDAARQQHAARHDLRDPAPDQRERFEAEHELDTSHTIAGVGRFRVNVCLQRGTSRWPCGRSPTRSPSSTPWGSRTGPSFTDLRRGLVLVTGPTGSGKSTSLASLVDIINRTKPLHIVTVEDPIEFLHDHKRSIISQREVGADTISFSEALRRVLRQDPDVILVGELRDLETISTALTAAETGHLVFATLHTQDAPSTIDRVIDVFPPNQQDQIRIQLGSSLAGRGDPAAGARRPTATVGAWRREVLVCTPAIQNLIRGGQDPPDLLVDADRRAVRHADHGPEPGLAGAARLITRRWPWTGAAAKRTSGTTCTACVRSTWGSRRHGGPRRGLRWQPRSTTRSATRRAT